jgi:excisionase family DNA binding protein
VRLTPAEHAEVARLFRSKLASLRQQERPRHATRRLVTPAIDSPPGDGDLLSSSELALMLGVHPKTVARWATDDGLPCIRTIGGHRRYRWSDATAWLERGDA